MRCLDALLTQRWLHPGSVVANATLRPLLARLAASRKVHVSTEDQLFLNVTGRPAREIEAHAAGNWFGAWLFCGDPRLSQGSFALGSSGVIAADHAGRLRSVCGMVRSLRQAIDPELTARFTDQALANYALHALGGNDFTLWITSWTSPAAPAPRRRNGAG